MIQTRILCKIRFNFLKSNFELQKIDFFERYENRHKMCYYNEVLFRKFKNRLKPLVSDETLRFKSLLAK